MNEEWKRPPADTTQRGTFDECITVTCQPYGTREIWYCRSNCSAEFVNQILESWENKWSAFQAPLENMIGEEDNADWGNLEMLQDGWELRLYHPWVDEKDLPKSQISLSLIFIVDGEFRACHWDVSLDGDEFVYCQPSF